MSFVVIAFLLFTLAVLIAGVVVMTKGGAIDKKYSNKLMQARIALQAITIVVLIASIYLIKG